MWVGCQKYKTCSSSPSAQQYTPGPLPNERTAHKHTLPPEKRESIFLLKKKPESVFVSFVFLLLLPKHTQTLLL